jgi:hypothetical protein
MKHFSTQQTLNKIQETNIYISVHCNACSVITFAITDLYLQLILHIKATLMQAGICLSSVPDSVT